MLHSSPKTVVVLTAAYMRLQTPYSSALHTNFSSQSMTLLKDIFHLHYGQGRQLSLITSVLGASASWYSHSLLTETLMCSEMAVIVLSFTHDEHFYTEGARRMVCELLVTFFL